MSVFSSLTNRIFFATALLAVLSISVAIYIVNRAVSRQVENELVRGLEEATRLVDVYRNMLFDNFKRDARFIADLPRLKAALDTQNPMTVQGVAQEYQQSLPNADLFALADRQGRLLFKKGAAGVPDQALVAAMQAGATRGSTTALWQEGHDLLLVTSVPVPDPTLPDPLGTLCFGASLDERQAQRFKELTDSEIAFGVNGAIQASTMPRSAWGAMASLLSSPGVHTVTINGNEYLAITKPLADPDAALQPMSIVLRSRSDRLAFLSALHTQLAATAVVAVLIAVLFSYGIARTVTRPLGAITTSMREMAASGDLSRPIPVAPERRWQDEDARLLTRTFNAMTDSIVRFQREAAQRERLSSLGRLSTVIAHEIRNPLMIIKTSLRSLRRDDATAAQVQTAAKDIDEETTRLNRIVTEVLDFARPIRFDLESTDPNALVEDAVRAAAAGAGPRAPVRVDLDPSLTAATTDVGRLRQALVNIIDNALHAVDGVSAAGPDAAVPGAEAGDPPVRVQISRLDARRFVIVVSDRGAGIAPEDLPRVFDPFFTTRRTGTGIGLAISRNIIEGLGGRITVSNARDRGTDVRIELPLDSRNA